MATISSLANTKRTTQAGGGITTGGMAASTQISPTKNIDNNAGLVSDIGKLLNLDISEHRKASEYAGKRVGIDNLVAYSNDVAKINQSYAAMGDLTSKDMLLKSDAEKELYDYYVKKGMFEADNEVANRAYKDTFALPASEHLAKSITQNTAAATQLFKKETAIAIDNETRITGELGLSDRDSVKAYVSAQQQRAKDSGNSPAIVDVAVSDTLNKALNRKYDINELLPIYNDDGSVNGTLQMNAFNSHYGGAVTIDENGAVTSTILDDASTQKIIDNWSSLVHAKSKTSSPPSLVASLPSATAKDTPSVIQGKLNIVNDTQNKLIKAQANGIGKITPSLAVKLAEKEGELRERYTSSQHLQDQIALFSQSGYLEDTTYFTTDDAISYSFVNPSLGEVQHNTFTVSKSDKLAVAQESASDKESIFNSSNTPFSDRIKAAESVINLSHNLPNIKTPLLDVRRKNAVDGLANGNNLEDMLANFYIGSDAINSKNTNTTWLTPKNASYIQTEIATRMAKLDEMKKNGATQEQLTKEEGKYRDEMQAITLATKYNVEGIKKLSPEQRLINTSLNEYQHSAIFSGRLSDHAMSSATKMTLLNYAQNINEAAKGALDKDNVDDFVSNFMDKHTITIENNTLGFDGQVILQPTGYDGEDTSIIANRIIDDIKKNVSSEEFATFDFKDKTKVTLSSVTDPDDKTVHTLAVVRDKDNGTILTTLDYKGNELLFGIKKKPKKASEQWYPNKKYHRKSRR